MDRTTKYTRYQNLEYTECTKCDKCDKQNGICYEYTCDNYKEAYRVVQTDYPMLGYASLEEFNRYFGTDYKE